MTTTPNESDAHLAGQELPPSANPFVASLSLAPLVDLPALLKDPRLEEEGLLALLARPDLPGTILDEIARRRDWLQSYAVKRAIVFHANAPRPAMSRLLRDIYLMDLVKLANAPATPADIRRAAEEQLNLELPQLPLGQKIALARQASARVLGALLIEGNRKVVPPVLQNPRLTEAQLLKTLAREKLGAAVVPAIARDARWSARPTVRLALLRHPQLPLETAVPFLAHLSSLELRTLASQPNLSSSLRRHVAHEIPRHPGAARD